ncbi:2-C-methyl-D-erythritol 2,4-cyclodiphosphate synthase [Treponema sp. OMZ 840]|uniref:2-C-methyl-D-erythritol 2,4-cyclodiphosphate synthase n=1 Tax=Treponema sp. OMZ 840 TaxID=244313 RepID=UPI003D93041A
MDAKTVALILTAAGTSSRFAADEKKEYRALSSSLFPGQKDGTVLSCSAESFLFAVTSDTNYVFIRLVITLPPQKNDKTFGEQALRASPFVADMLNILNVTPEFIHGGETRRESVLFALEHLAKENTALKTPDLVLIHDAARPFVSPEIIKNVLELAAQKGAAAPGVPPVDTYKEISADSMRIVRHLPRSLLTAVQTPQGFCFEKLLDAHRKACADGKTYTDDTEIWGMYEGDVYLCEGDRKNIKITYKEDLPASACESKTFKIGLGSDTHKLVPGRPLLIGGIRIPFDKGEQAHSDGDVLLHAITDALLGASGLADIGELFPPSDTAWKNADSAVLLKKAWQKIRKAGWQLENLDCVLSIEQPKMLPWRNKICEKIASILDCGIHRVFVKAKTAEGLGDIGEGRAVSALCTCLLYRE